MYIDCSHAAFGSLFPFLHAEAYDVDRGFKNVDLFAGKAAISKAFRRRNLSSIALDIDRSPGDVA